jgi:hypothetical protein
VQDAKAIWNSCALALPDRCELLRSWTLLMAELPQGRSTVPEKYGLVLLSARSLFHRTGYISEEQRIFLCGSQMICFSKCSALSTFAF